MSQDGKDPSEPAQASLQFITVTEASYKHGKPQQHPDVRRHVMLGRRRRERLAATQEFQQRRMQDSAIRFMKSTGLSLPAAHLRTDEATRQPKEDSEGKQSDPVVEGLLALTKQHPAAWRLDPFGSFAAPLDGHVQVGLEYCECIAFLHAIRPAWILTKQEVAHVLHCLPCMCLLRPGHCAITTTAARTRYDIRPSKWQYSKRLTRPNPCTKRWTLSF